MTDVTVERPEPADPARSVGLRIVGFTTDGAAGLDPACAALLTGVPDDGSTNTPLAVTPEVRSEAEPIGWSTSD